MRRRILYYPSIDITDGVWLRNAVLYWEEVSSIMPYQNNEYSISPEINYLISTGNFVPTRPDDIMFSNKYDEFINEVRRKFDEYNPHENQHPHLRREYIHRSKVEKDYIKLHGSKLSDQIIELFQSKSEIIQSNNSQWISVEKELSDIYMSVLAKYLAIISDEDTAIGTDNLSTQNILYKPQSIRIDRDNRQSLLNYNFNILPVPDTSVSLEDILTFKMNRQDELRNLRVEINNLETQLANADSITTIKNIWINFEDNLKRNINDINRLMRERHWRVKPYVMSGLIVASVPNILNTVEQFGVPINNFHKSIGVAVGTLLSIAITVKEEERFRANEINNNAFAYIYHANKSGLIRL